jgi:hypothetical protein
LSDAVHGAAELTGEAREEEHRQLRDVFDAIPQRRIVQRKHIQTVEQASAETAGGDRLRQIGFCAPQLHLADNLLAQLAQRCGLNFRQAVSAERCESLLFVVRQRACIGENLRMLRFSSR